MSYAEIISALSLLGGIVAVYAKLRSDLAEIAVKIEAMKEAHEVFKLEISSVGDNLNKGKVDKEVLQVIRGELMQQIAQQREDNTREHTELKKTIDKIYEYIRK